MYMEHSNEKKTAHINFRVSGIAGTLSRNLISFQARLYQTQVTKYVLVLEGFSPIAAALLAVLFFRKSCLKEMSCWEMLHLQRGKLNYESGVAPSQ